LVVVFVAVASPGH